MNTFVSLVIYMLIGGFIGVNYDNDYIEECGTHAPDFGITTMIVAWPSIIPIGLLGQSIEDGPSCHNTIDTP